MIAKLFSRLLDRLQAKLEQWADPTGELRAAEERRLRVAEYLAQKRYERSGEPERKLIAKMYPPGSRDV